MFFSIIIVASINKGTIEVKHPEMALTSSAIFGRAGAETPSGFFEVKKAYSTRLRTNMLVFKHEDGAVYAIHPTVNVKGQNREARLKSATPNDNRISSGCINIPQSVFDKLWNVKQNLLLQVM